MLHITNGDIAAGLLAQVVAGEILPWRDVLHEGPVRAGLSFDQLSTERARFIADCGWGAYDHVLEEFRHRDEVLETSGRHDEVVLWFEHDLYDQLQLMQLLDWFSRHPAAKLSPKLSLVCEAEYLGTMTSGRIAQLFDARRAVSGRQLEQGRAAWDAFTSEDPRRLQSGGFDSLRFAPAALRRHLEEYPWVADGFSRLERNILEVLDGGALAFKELFGRVKEEPAYLGDAVLRWHLERMQLEGLVARLDKTWSRSGVRRRRVPRWLGGVRVDSDSPWRWDADAARVVRVR